MRCTPLMSFAVACSLTLATAAHAGGINLSWDDCGTFGLDREIFACNTNVGVHTLVASFIQSVPLDQMVAVESAIELQVMAPSLSPWWDFTNNTGCRRTQFGSSADFRAGPFNCADPWQGQASGGQDFQAVFGSPGSGRIKVVYAVPSTSPIHIDGQSEYYAFEVLIRNGLTTGSGSCGGCLTPACMSLDYIRLDQPFGVGDWILSNPINRSTVDWQAAAVGQCSTIVPARRQSWGGIKSLYR
jgi:hypothetical protein